MESRSGRSPRAAGVVAWRCAALALAVLQAAATGQTREAPESRSANEDEETRVAEAGAAPPTFEALKAAGALRSIYRNHQPRAAGTGGRTPQLDSFREDILPVLSAVCFSCHGAERQKGNLRIDTLDPDLLHGDDVEWWLDVVSVLSNGEMPPEGKAQLSNENRSRVIEWLSSELRSASEVRRAKRGHSTFRRMTRYEYNYALQDLFGLPYDFASDLPPDPSSEDGFQNSSAMLHMSATQLFVYRAAGRAALERATVVGDRPTPLFWGISMAAASAVEWARQDEEQVELRRKHEADPETLKKELERHAATLRTRPGGTHYEDLTNGRFARQSWNYDGARYAWAPEDVLRDAPTTRECVAIIPAGQRLIVELGDQVPLEGDLRVRVRAARATADGERAPSLQLEFGWQASNDSQASVRISGRDLAIDASPEHPQFYEWSVPLSEIYPRNSVRDISKMGDLPSPSEYLKLVNSSVSKGDIRLDYLEVRAPVHDRWPPDSHTRVFIDSVNKSDERVYAREVLVRFMARAWRRDVTAAEVDQKLLLFTALRPRCDSFQEAMIEVLASVLSSPKFLYLVRSGRSERADLDSKTEPLSNAELATRLSMFLWCSTPDDELLELASTNRLRERDVLIQQLERMLGDPRSRRFSMHFVRQWLGLELLDFLKVDRQAYPEFDASLKEAMLEEPIAFFHELLQNDHSALCFLHADFTMANERLAKHYGFSGVFGNDFRRVTLAPNDRRGGLLTEAGLLAMNSDGKDSHPLKRGVWLLKRLLNDPPPPPPPAVPEIDLADPEIAKMTLRQRIENHRDHPACMSCHAKIDPWGIAFENFDAVGRWRTEIQGKPVDATAALFNDQELDGIDGLKRFLLEYRQDQFARAMVHKLATYALGRPLTFEDRASVDQITADLREAGDGVATMVKLLAASDLFQSR